TSRRTVMARKRYKPEEIVAKLRQVDVLVCIRCKTMDCVEVCPVDCFYEGENMLVIHPDECIDCGVCEPECPVDAIKADSEPGLEKWLSLNAEYARIWQILRSKKRPRRTLSVRPKTF